MIDRSKTRDTPRMAVAFEAANLFGTRVAETNLASAQYETQQQAGHMNANDPIKFIRSKPCKQGAVHICHSFNSYFPTAYDCFCGPA